MTNPDYLFPIEPSARQIARELYSSIKSLPIISPHGHTDPKWFSDNLNFADPASLLVIPDHYILRMLYSQGVSLENLGRGDKKTLTPSDSERIWQIFSRNYHLFRGTPTQAWLNFIFTNVFDLTEPLSSDTADLYYETISEKLKLEDFKPRELYKKFNIEVLATTDDATDTLNDHKKIRDSLWSGRVIPTFRPDKCLDPEHESFKDHLILLAEITKEDTSRFSSYLRALKSRRQHFKNLGATATDHGVPSAYTNLLSEREMQILLDKALTGQLLANEAQAFRGHMLIEMAKMSLDDELVMQIHPGSYRNHNAHLFLHFGRDVGADIPQSTEYTQNLKPFLDAVGNEARLKVIIFTLDESRYSTELAPLAGHYPCLKLGPAWWFHDSPEGLLRFRRLTTETAGFYNTVGFNDDTRAFFSIPARHDVARRIDCRFLSELVAEGRMSERDAFEVAQDLTYNLPKQSYNL